MADRPKYHMSSPANFMEPAVAAEDKAEGNSRKHFHRKGARSKGRSGKGHVTESKRAHSRRA